MFLLLKKQGEEAVLLNSNNRQYTKKQETLASWIRELGFGCILEKEFPPYFVDIFVPGTGDWKLNLAIEIDGPWHISKVKDNKREIYLKDTYGINFIRFSDIDIIKSNKENILELLKSIIVLKYQSESNNE